MGENSNTHITELLARVDRAPLLRLARRLVGSADAEDVVQTAYTKAFKSVSSYRGDADLSTWLYSITRNCAFDLLRKRNRYSEHQLPPNPQMAYEPDFHVPLKGEVSPLQQGIASLSRFDRATLRAAAQFESRAEGAHALGITPQAFKSRLNRARNRVRRSLGALADVA